MNLVAKRLPGYYFDGEREGYAILIDGKKVGAITRQSEYTVRRDTDREWDAHISVGKMTIGTAGTNLSTPDLRRMLTMVRSKVESLPKQVLKDFLAKAPVWSEEDEA